MPGIGHGASASGASLFLEPLGTVDVNNEIVALEEQEAEEVRRILLELTDLFRARPDDIARTVDAASDLDVLQARARFSQSVDGVEPRLSTDGAFELLAARHPLLKAAVPVTIRILPPASVLLVTGPNTGGKTVALKTAGLFVLMAQSGLRIPAADGSRLPVFRSVFADIGEGVLDVTEGPDGFLWVSTATRILRIPYSSPVGVGDGPAATLGPSLRLAPNPSRADVALEIDGAPVKVFEGDEQVGESEHDRFIVDLDKYFARLDQKLGAKT